MKQHCKTANTTNNEPTILDFIRKVRNDNDTKKKNEANIMSPISEYYEESISTQEMINDSRARRLQKKNVFNCEKCEFKSGSETLIKRHMETNHKIDQPTVLQSTKTKTYISKRINCNFCDKKFNKETTFEKHMKKIHKANINSRNVNEKQNENCDLPNMAPEVQPRVTRQRNIKTNVSPWNPNN